jgi:hypothetical protein
VQEHGVVRPAGAGLEQTPRVAARPAEVRLLDEQDTVLGRGDGLVGSRVSGERAALVDQHHAADDACERGRGEPCELCKGVVLGTEGGHDDGQRPDGRLPLDRPLGRCEQTTLVTGGQLDPAPVGVGGTDVQRPRHAVGQVDAGDLVPTAPAGAVDHETPPTSDREPHRGDAESRPPADGCGVRPGTQVETAGRPDVVPAVGAWARVTAPEERRRPGSERRGSGDGETLQGGR